MTEPRVVDVVKVGGKVRVAPAVINDSDMRNRLFPGLKAAVLKDMSKFGTVVESTLEWNIELPDPMDYAPDDQGWRSYPFIVFTAYVMPAEAICPECGHPISEHGGRLGGLCMHEDDDFCSCGDYYDVP